MPGWNTSCGSITNPTVAPEQIWGYFNILFSNRSTNTASYKFGFIRALLENLYNVDTDYCVDFGHLFWSFTCLYWNLSIRHGLTQVNKSHQQSAVERILRDLQDKHSIPADVGFDSLPQELQREIVLQIKAEGKRYVIGAVWGDTEGTFYEFDLGRELLRINPPVYHLMQQYQEALYRLNSYEFVKFLQKVNPPETYGNLIETVENLTKRSSLSEYRAMLEFGSHQCFYCSRDLSGRGEVAVDHFVPWAFVHSDRLWNLVLACRTCNGSKNDRLAPRTYLDQVAERNEKLLSADSETVRREMADYRAERLTDLYDFAQKNGYLADWKPAAGAR